MCQCVCVCVVGVGGRAANEMMSFRRQPFAATSVIHRQTGYSHFLVSYSTRVIPSVPNVVGRGVAREMVSFR